MAIITTGRWGLRTPDEDEEPDIPGHFLLLATDLSNVAMDSQGTLAARPPSTALSPSNEPGRYWYVTGDEAANDGRLWRDTGQGWVELAVVLRASVAWNPGPIAAGDYTYTTVAVPGAKPGNVCMASFAPFAGAHVVVSANVLSNDQVVVTLHNARLTDSTDPASGTVGVVVMRGS